MSFRDVYIFPFRVFILLLRLLSYIAWAPYIICLVTFRICYHLPRILTNRPSVGRNVNPSQLVTPSKPFNQQHEGLEPYQYEPLPGGRYIRLLQVKKSRGRDDVEYQLHTMSLDHPFAGYVYRAISYAWDGQVPDRFIVCSGKKLAVTQNCETILRQMRRHAKLLMWIDAVCIDLSSVNEKSTQIPLMSKIYRRAFVVHIWMGEPTEGSSIVFSYSWLLWCCLAFPEPVKSYLQERVHGLILDRNHDRYFREFCRRNWWRRVWTIQEAALAPAPSWYSPLLVSCGAEDIPLECLNVGLMSALALSVVQKYSYNSMIWMTTLLAHSLPRLSLEYPEKRLEVGILMFRNRACNAADPRDRVYGLYGMLQEFGLKLPQPSYWKTKTDVYWEFTVTACQQTGSLELLALVSSINASQSTPSWVPDYSEVFREGDYLGMPRAAGKSESRFYFTDDGRRLVARGALIDYVRATSDLTAWQPDPTDSVVEDGPLVNLEEGYEQTIRAFRDWYNVLLTGGASDRYDDEGLLSAFAQSLTSGMIAWADLSSAAEKRTSIYHWLALLQDEKRDRSAELAMARAEQEIREHFYDDPKRRHMTESEEWQTLCVLKNDPCTASLHHAIWMLMRDKTFFVTVRGNMGTAHSSIRARDAIYLLEGVGRPMILRPSETPPRHWQLVCPAYIEGIMDGKLWNEEVDLEDIPII